MFCVSSACRSQSQYFFLANADILMFFAMQSPSVFQKSLSRLQVKDRASSCGRTILSSVLLFSRQEDCPAVGDISESKVGTDLLG